jgi:hypothetical protein
VGFGAQQYIAQPNFSEGLRMGWLVRLWDETIETPRPDVMPEAQLASKIAWVLLPIARKSAEEAEEERVVILMMGKDLEVARPRGRF